jgi:hypothetical protein
MVTYIPKQIEAVSGSRPAAHSAPAANTDARTLFQLGLALGVVYLLFLVAWFWGTRGRHGIGRMVRF